METPRFTQIAVGQWTGQSKMLNHSVYALSEDGVVYRFSKHGGWSPLKREERRPGKTDEEPF